MPPPQTSPQIQGMAARVAVALEADDPTLRPDPANAPFTSPTNFPATFAHFSPNVPDLPPSDPALDPLRADSSVLLRLLCATALRPGGPGAGASLDHLLQEALMAAHVGARQHPETLIQGAPTEIAPLLRYAPKPEQDPHTGVWRIRQTGFRLRLNDHLPLTILASLHPGTLTLEFNPRLFPGMSGAFYEREWRARTHWWMNGAGVTAHAAYDARSLAYEWDRLIEGSLTARFVCAVAWVYWYCWDTLNAARFNCLPDHLYAHPLARGPHYGPRQWVAIGFAPFCQLSDYAASRPLTADWTPDGVARRRRSIPWGIGHLGGHAWDDVGSNGQGKDARYTTTFLRLLGDLLVSRSQLRAQAQRHFATGFPRDADPGEIARFAAQECDAEGYRWFVTTVAGNLGIPRAILRSRLDGHWQIPTLADWCTVSQQLLYDMPDLRQWRNLACDAWNRRATAESEARERLHQARVPTLADPSELALWLMEPYGAFEVTQ